MYSSQRFNTIYLGICFFVLFSAFMGLNNIQKTLLTSIKLEDPTYIGDGYLCLCVLYVVFAISIWIAPSVVSIIGPKYCMAIGSTFYTICIAAQYIENGYVTYVGFAMNGLGAALLWTGHANYIVLNSDIGKVAKGVGLFWMFFEASSIPINLFIYHQFEGKDHIDRQTRVAIITGLSSLALLSGAMLCFLKPPVRDVEVVGPTLQNASHVKPSPLEEFKKSFHIAKAKNLMLLYSTVVYTGLHLTFISVLSASIGFSKTLTAHSNELVPIAGFCRGVGCVTGGILPQYYSGKRWGILRPVIVYAILGNLITYLITFLALPSEAAFSYTDAKPMLAMHFGFLLLASALAGLGDTCLHTDTYDLLGALYPHDSAPAFAVFNFLRNVTTAGSFLYSNYLSLHIQIGIMSVMAILSFFTYHVIVCNNEDIFAKPSEETSLKDEQKKTNVYVVNREERKT